ncbi:hypothetical protein FRC12_007512 [Ceratobasidium sp. 428]|nr:hypothetical protein FRC12_007512 [Ceratobasidium sp. 428]
MSQTSTSRLVVIGPSGSSQATIPLTTPTNTFPTSTSLTTTTTPRFPTMSSVSSSPATASSPSSGGSAVSRTPNLGAIIGGTLGGIVALLWFIGLMYFAHRNNCFRRPGYKRAMQERGAFEKRERPRSGNTDVEGSFAGRPPGPPGPQAGIGARTFGEPPRPTFNEPPKPTFSEPPKTTFGGKPPPPRPIFADLRSDFGFRTNDPPKNTANDPPKNTFNDPPRTTFNAPPRTNFNDPPRSTFGQPRSNYENRPISGFGERERPRSSFGERPRSAFGDRRSVDQDRPRRGFFGGMLHSDGTGGEWEGAGARREAGYGTPEMEEKTAGWWGWLTRARDNAERRKRVKAEYEEDMKQMRGRVAVESDYPRF